MEEKCKPTKESRSCPYCDEDIAEAAFPYCEACEVETFSCPGCGHGIPREEEVCPECHINIREEALKEK